MASATPTYNFTDEEVSHLANCDTQDDFLLNFQRILQTKGIDVETTRQLCLRAAKQQGAGGCKPRHGRGDRKRERSFWWAKG